MLPREEGFSIPVPLIIDVSTWQEAQRRIAERTRTRGQPDPERFLLPAWLSARSTGGAMGGTALRRRWRYYRCERANARTRPDRRYPSRGRGGSVPAEAAEELVWQAVRSWVENPEELTRALREACGGAKEGLGRETLVAAVQGLGPLHLLRHNPVMFAVEAGFALVLLHLLLVPARRPYEAAVALILLATNLFASAAEAYAEARGKARARSLRQVQAVLAKKVAGEPLQGALPPFTLVPAASLRPGDLVLVEKGDLIPLDGEVTRGVALVDESAITGESAPVLKEAGGDFNSVTGGTVVVSDWLLVRVTAAPGQSLVDRMIALIEGARRQKTPNEIALSLLLYLLTLTFLLVILTLPGVARLRGATADPIALVSLFVCLIPTTISGLLPAMGIAGMDRLARLNVIAKSGRAVEAAGDVATLVLDKTGTITLGNRLAWELIPINGHSPVDLTVAALKASLRDETPEGRSVVELARRKGASFPAEALGGVTPIPFSAYSRMSGTDFPDGSQFRKGAPEAIRRLVAENGGRIPPDLDERVNEVARAGGTPLVVAEREKGGPWEVLGVIYLKDIVKPGLQERFANLRRMGIRTVMCTGDNPLTAATIAREAGVDDYRAQARPEEKVEIIREEQARGRLVAMAGDGTNDAPALAQADVALAMHTGTHAAKEAANMVDLDSDPTKLLEVIQVGKQLLLTRGALTTFSIMNDVAKYFALVPAMFGQALPQLQALDVMRLHSPESAVLSALLFNALIIPALIPLALKGVAFRPAPPETLLRRNLLLYGLGGVAAPFLGIKLLDLLLLRLLPGL